MIAEKLNGQDIKVENRIEIKDLTERLDKLLDKEPVKVEEKKIEFPQEFKVSNLGDIKIPEQKEIKIPEQKEFPKEIGVKDPKWFSMKAILDGMKDLKGTLIKVLDINPDKYKKKSEALAVRLVTEDGAKFYNAGGGGGGQTSATEGLATEETLQAVATNPLAKYVTQAIDDYSTASTTYFCKMKSDGTWLFMKIDETGNFPTFTFANVSNNATKTTYALAWADRVTLTYNYLNILTI